MFHPGFVLDIDESALGVERDVSMLAAPIVDVFRAATLQQGMYHLGGCLADDCSQTEQQACETGIRW